MRRHCRRDRQALAFGGAQFLAPAAGCEEQQRSRNSKESHDHPSFAPARRFRGRGFVAAA
jgi:hypothetical protein